MTRGRTATLVSWLKLGRVSNLPTVWSNTLAAIALSGGEWTMGLAAASAVSMSLFYVAGMILNDVFDAEYDGIHRPTRPIPSGQVGRAVAAATGFSGLGLATMVVVALAFSRGVHASGALTWTLLLAATIVGYDVYHKTNPLSPVVMGGCRALVLLCVSWTAVGTIAAPVLIAAGLQWAYVVGLTYAAKQEDLARPGSFWPVFLVFLAPIVVGSVECIARVNDGRVRRLDGHRYWTAVVRTQTNWVSGRSADCWNCGPRCADDCRHRQLGGRGGYGTGLCSAHEARAALRSRHVSRQRESSFRRTRAPQKGPKRQVVT
jgi:hypothetical protein